VDERRSNRVRALWMAGIAMAACLAMGPSAGRAEKITLKRLFTVDRFGGDLRFQTPVAAFVHPNRPEIYVCDAGAKRLITLSSDGKSLGWFSHRKKGRPASSEPDGVAVGADGTVFVADASDSALSRYTYRGDPIGGAPMAGLKHGYSPGKMAYDAGGNLYVAVRNAGKVVVFSPTGEMKTEIGTAATDGMSACCDVAVDADGNVYTLSPSGAAVHVFDKRGQLVRRFGYHEPGRAGFALPSGLDVDGKGRLWITDAVNQTLRVFRADGTFLAEFGGMGDLPGAFFTPVDVCVDRVRQTLYVVEKSGQRVQAFAIEDS